MDKAQRKREARERKARGKAARKAKNQARREAEATNSPGETTTPVDPRLSQRASNAGGETSTVDAGGDAHITNDAHTTNDARTTEKPWHLMTQEELRADPELMEAVLASRHRDEESCELMDTAQDAEWELDRARRKVAEARSTPRQSSGQAGQAVSRRRITDERALEMLEDAAEAVHDVLLMVRDALRGVSPERREAARAILNEKPQSGVNGRKLPRRAPDPVVTLERLNLQAASLLKRILAKTNPGVGKKKAA